MVRSVSEGAASTVNCGLSAGDGCGGPVSSPLRSAGSRSAATQITGASVSGAMVHMRRGGVETPALPEVVVRATAAQIFFACLAAALVLTVAAPERLAAVLALGFLALGLGTAVLARRA